jgi:hypothetical protein
MMHGQIKMKPTCENTSKRTWRCPVIARIDIKRTMNFVGSLSDTGRATNGSITP